MTTPLPDIVNRATDLALDFFNEGNKTAFLFHDYNRGVQVARLVEDLSIGSGLSDKSPEVEVAKLCAHFSNMGHTSKSIKPSEAAKTIASEFLKENHYPPHKMRMVMDCLDQTSPGHIPNSPEAKLLADAETAYLTSTNFGRLSPLLRLERELVHGEKVTPLEWEQQMLATLLGKGFRTSFGKIHFGGFLHANILEQKNKVDVLATKRKKVVINEEDHLRVFQHIEPKGNPLRGAQTFFRSVYRNHINLSAIADNKANMMTGINAILVSVIISLITYGNLIFHHKVLLLPISIFLVTALVSLVFSVMAASPRVTRSNNKIKDKLQIRKNIAFFGNFSGLRLDEYEEAMDAMLRDDELLYGNMSRDLYFLGKALDRKYRLLRFSYLIFMAGFTVSVLIFLFVFVIPYFNS